MPISGMLFSGALGHGFGVFSWHLMPENPSLTKPGEVIAYSEFWANVGHTAHEVGGYLILGLLLLHVLGALKHHFIDKDGILKRMLGVRLE